MGLNNNIIYIHGFASSGNSYKGQLLKREFPNKVVAPDLSSKPHEDIEIIDNLIKSLTDPVLVGSSLGGFYGDYFSRKYGLKALLINPLVNVYDIKSFIGENRYFHNDDIFYFSKDDYDCLLNIQNELNSFSEPYSKRVIIVSTDDDLVDCSYAIKHFTSENDYLIKYNSGGHSFNCDHEILYALSHILN